ncbi:MAG TPA: alpha-L-arabinofuranosidase C-terminal domain-containing protein, partial [Puia sp.]|nr:alpha-L-arabinofuranosidase C-terminal domain-containing protein [Puia sp.]
MKRLLLCAFCLSQASAFSQDLTVRVDRPGAAIPSTMWGIFFEDINMAADGGLYAELVKNRSFEFNTPLMGWKEHSAVPGDGSILVLNRGTENPANPRFIRISHFTDGAYGLSNEGFRGMGIKKDEPYHFSVWTRMHTGTDIGLRLELVGQDGQKIATAQLKPAGGEGWQKNTVSMTAGATDPKAQLYIWLEGRGSIDVDMVSLFPQHTWKERPGGLRADLVQLLADMKPGFIRFPGGCIVEGRDLSNRYQWKNTVGKVEDRKLIINRWNTEFSHRPTPDYFQSFGLGFFEYFQLAEDIGAEPLPILNCGMACQFNTAEVVPTDELGPYIQDALDLIEFANGPVSGKWGGLRAAMGHPEPFHLKMMGVGNEQWGPQYVERYTIFTKAIKDKYPDIRLVNSVGPNPDGDLFNFLNDTLRKLHADILDEHYYRQPEWFLQNAGRYDHYDRSGPKIFAGEYAAQSKAVVSPQNKNTWQCALSEAAYMTGLERNADVVQMASYAPLFAHVDGWQWTPDLIWFDNLRSYGTPDYYVQKLFSTNKGSVVVPLSLAGGPLEGLCGLYGSATLDNKT